MLPGEADHIRGWRFVGLKGNSDSLGVWRIIIATSTKSRNDHFSSSQQLRRMARVTTVMRLGLSCGFCLQNRGVYITVNSYNNIVLPTLKTNIAHLDHLRQSKVAETNRIIFSINIPNAMHKCHDRKITSSWMVERS